MKKTLFTLLLGFSFLFLGASFVKAEAAFKSPKSFAFNRTETRNYVNALMKMKCIASPFSDCAQLLANLRSANSAYENYCVRQHNNCSYWSAELIEAGDAYNNAGCVPPDENATYLEKRLDRKILTLGKNDSKA